MIGEQISWIPVAERMPDDDITVMIAFADADVWIGYRDGETWREVGGPEVENVTHWAEMPEGPA